MAKQESADTTIHVGLTQGEVTKLDAEVNRIRALAPGSTANRASVIRALIGTLGAPAAAPAKRRKKSAK